jgi:4-hydroxythreonine-4-phosphate dehydrogenase
MSIKKVIITCGDPAGCGPRIALQAIRELRQRGIVFFLVGDSCLLEKTALFRKIRKDLVFVDAATPGAAAIKPGFASRLSGKASLGYLVTAMKIMKDKDIARLVTAPLSKEAVRSVLPEFCGHTEYLADYFKTGNVAMMMASPKIKVVLLTRHIPLREVSLSLKKKKILATFGLVYAALKDNFGIKKPRIAVASFNPHAGLYTFMEREEKLIAEAIGEFKGALAGPLPADTIFIKENLRRYDCVICAYHDQAMIPFKLLSMHNGVNLTLGLPIIRTSPAHGVAYDVMRQGRVPFYSSMSAAVKLALTLSP